MPIGSRLFVNCSSAVRSLRMKSMHPSVVTHHSTASRAYCYQLTEPQPVDCQVQSCHSRRPPSFNLSKQYHYILGQNRGDTLAVVPWRSLEVKLQPHALLQALSGVSYVVQSALVSLRKSLATVRFAVCNQDYGASAQEAEADLASAAMGHSAGKTNADSIGWDGF